MKGNDSWGKNVLVRRFSFRVQHVKLRDPQLKTTNEERGTLFDRALGRFLVGEGDVHFISYFDAQCFGRAR